MMVCPVPAPLRIFIVDFGVTHSFTLFTRFDFPPVPAVLVTLVYLLEIRPDFLLYVTWYQPLEAWDLTVTVLFFGMVKMTRNLVLEPERIFRLLVVLTCAARLAAGTCSVPCTASDADGAAAGSGWERLGAAVRRWLAPGRPRPAHRPAARLQLKPRIVELN